MSDRCPFAEQDCLRARDLLHSAMKLLVQYEKDPTLLLTVEAEDELQRFLNEPDLAPLVTLIRTGRVPMPAAGMFEVPR